MSRKRSRIAFAAGFAIAAIPLALVALLWTGLVHAAPHVRGYATMVAIPPQFNNDYLNALNAQGSVVGCWPLNETSGTVFKDLSPNNNGGSFGSGVTLNASPLVVRGGNAATFDGSANAFGTIPYISAYNIASAYTIIVWVADNDTADLQQFMAYHDVVAGTWNNYYGIQLTNSKQQFVQASAGAFDVPFGSNDFHGVTRHMVAEVWDGINDKLYVDGVSDGSFTAANATMTAWASGQPFIIGARRTSNGSAYENNANGSLGYVSVQSRADSPAQILNLWNKGK